MFKLAISLLGIPIGAAIAYLAQEELKIGKKYFLWLQRVLFVIFLIIAGVLSQNYLIIGILAIILGLLYFKSLWAELVKYALFFGAYLALSRPSILATIIFLYSLILGTLLYEKKIQSG